MAQWHHDRGLRGSRPLSLLPRGWAEGLRGCICSAQAAATLAPAQAAAHNRPHTEPDQTSTCSEDKGRLREQGCSTPALAAFLLYATGRSTLNGAKSTASSKFGTLHPRWW